MVAGWIGKETGGLGFDWKKKMKCQDYLCECENEGMEFLVQMVVVARFRFSREWSFFYIFFSFFLLWVFPKFLPRTPPICVWV